jgi:hypothetical protein
MLKEKVATIELLVSKTNKIVYEITRCAEDVKDFWFYTFEDEKEIIKTFAVGLVEPNVYSPQKTSVEEYLEEFKNQVFPTPCIILYEVEYLHKNDLGRKIGFKTLKKWYEEFLKYADDEILKLLTEDFVKGFWKIYEKFYRESEDFRKLLFIERYRLSNMFSSVLGYVKDVITEGKPKDYVEGLYGKEFVNWLCKVANKV